MEEYFSIWITNFFTVFHKHMNCQRTRFFLASIPCISFPFILITVLLIMKYCKVPVYNMKEQNFLLHNIVYSIQIFNPFLAGFTSRIMQPKIKTI